ncbi:hypothetical protein GvMRE_IIg354 [endosymbiont GvMRE of Glomus versiforme]|nr:hypothetical protein GvMRE_IIg354 [endosymbiont GvMRE of Glomus versiforme]
MIVNILLIIWGILSFSLDVKCIKCKERQVLQIAVFRLKLINYDTNCKNCRDLIPHTKIKKC